MPSLTGWTVAKIDKITHTADITNLKLGLGTFSLSLIDPNGKTFKISANAVASGISLRFFRDKNDPEAKKGPFGDGKINFEKVVEAEGDNLLKDLLKLVNKRLSPSGKLEIYYIPSPVTDNLIGENKDITPIPSAKSFTSCALNVFSFKAKASLGIAGEGSFDVYTFTAGHHFTPLLTSYCFTTVSLEMPLMDIFTLIRHMITKEKPPTKGLELSFVQYYCPFIGLDSSGLIDSGLAYAKELYDANEKLKKKFGHWHKTTFPYIPESKRPPMISPDK
jgi:hypothetical protein